MLWSTDFEDLKFSVTPLLDYPHLFLFDCWSSLLFSRIRLVLGNSFAQGQLYNVPSLAFIKGAYQTERHSFSFSLEKTLMLGKTKGKRGSGWQRMRRLDSITDSMHMKLSKLQEIVEDTGVWLAVVHEVKRVGHELVTEQQ